MFIASVFLFAGSANVYDATKWVAKFLLTNKKTISFKKSTSGESMGNQLNGSN